MEGKKWDNGKPRFSLIDPEVLLAVAKVLTSGANKYGDENWKLVEQSRYVDALERHLNDWKRGMMDGVEENQHPMAAVICNAMFIMVHDRLKGLTSEEK